jgi:hypothetical protein
MGHIDEIIEINRRSHEFAKEYIKEIAKDPIAREVLLKPPLVRKYYLLTYKCSRCNQTWSEISPIKHETMNCRYGCTDPPTWLFLIRLFLSLFSRKEPYGVGELIESREIEMYFPRD